MRAKFTTSIDGVARRNVSVTLRLTTDEVAKLERIRGEESSAKSLNVFLRYRLEDAIEMTLEQYDR